jgi:hypothetical protein
MAYALTVRQLFHLHLLTIACLAALNLVPLAGDALGHRRLYGFARLFRVSEEGNVPTLFSAFALGATAVAAYAIAQTPQTSEQDSRVWRLVSIIFGFMAIDEAVQLHEMLNLVGQAEGSNGIFLNVGVFPYLMLAVTLAVTMLPFWWRQEQEVRFNMFLGGCIYTLAATVPEMPENFFLSEGVARTDLRMGVLYAIEELGEMLGVAVILRSFLLCYVSRSTSPIFCWTMRPDSKAPLAASNEAEGHPAPD